MGQGGTAVFAAAVRRVPDGAEEHCSRQVLPEILSSEYNTYALD